MHGRSVGNSKAEAKTGNRKPLGRRAPSRPPAVRNRQQSDRPGLESRTGFRQRRSISNKMCAERTMKTIMVHARYDCENKQLSVRTGPGTLVFGQCRTRNRPWANTHGRACIGRGGKQVVSAHRGCPAHPRNGRTTGRAASSSSFGRVS